MTCEDYPCCGHDICPDFDPDTGRQLNMRCTCGAVVPLSSRSSLCSGCLRGPDPFDGGYEDYEPSPYYGDDLDGGVEDYYEDDYDLIEAQEVQPWEDDCY
jgi:hypothetical protein